MREKICFDTGISTVKVEINGEPVKNRMVYITMLSGDLAKVEVPDTFKEVHVIHIEVITKKGPFERTFIGQQSLQQLGHPGYVVAFMKHAVFGGWTAVERAEAS